MATTAIIASSVAVNAALAAERAASNAKDVQCKIIMHEFNAQSATQQQQIDYADCVNRFRPLELTDPGQIVALKIYIVFFLLCTVCGGVWVGRRNDWEISECFWGAFFGFFFGLIVPIIGIGLCWLIKFLFTA